MKCMLCGEEIEGRRCPRCEFEVPDVMGSMNETIRFNLEKLAKMQRDLLLKDVKVYIRAYHWEEENDTLVEKFHEDILIAEDIQQMEIGQDCWSDIQFAKQTAGEPLQMTISVDDGKKTEYTVTVMAPDTQDMWNVGFVLKEGLRGVIKVGSSGRYAESDLISLKG